jgi:uncharacterized protein
MSTGGRVADEQENVQIVQRLFAEFGRGDIQAILEMLADDVEWRIPGPSDELQTAGTWRGREDIRRMFAIVAEEAEFEQFEPREFVARGDQVVALGRWRARYKPTGRSYETEWAMVFTLREGKVARIREYSDTAAWVAATRDA